MIVFTEGTNLGSAIEFSKNMLKTGESFKYICRRNGDRQSQLCRMEGSTCEIVGECLPVD